MDTFVEQIVAKRKGGKEYAIIFGSLIAALLILAALWLFLLFFIGIFFVLLLTAGIGWLLWYLITMQNVEFEYSVTNGDIDIDQITAQRKRKRIVSVSGKRSKHSPPITRRNMPTGILTAPLWRRPPRMHRGSGALPTTARKTAIRW